MKCRYCGSANSADDHRCYRCGRRLHLAAPRPAPEGFPLANSAVAPALDPPAARPPELPAGEAPVRPPVQASLFPRGEGLKIIPFPHVPGAAARPRKPRAPRNRRAEADQHALNFPETPADGGLETSVEAVLYCDAPVALPAHRLLAAAFDLSMILIAFGLFLLMFQLLGGAGPASSRTFLLVAGVTGIALVYELFWCLLGSDTPGMRWSGLRLVNFDGYAPGGSQRYVRLAAGWLSLAAAGIGLLWALADEESLTWHDHISKTFPTPVGAPAEDSPA